MKRRFIGPLESKDLVQVWKDDQTGITSYRWVITTQFFFLWMMMWKKAHMKPETIRILDGPRRPSAAYKKGRLRIVLGVLFMAVVVQ